ncbi:hypothetical protein GNI_083980 [Gregarina niphandrodes]|uniref:Uncharacterized protein n=1 Tax=Gregarina niphandrodes TaxID=110365 RepID=A0A023B6C9_GRENI|nr:hypothetical protein GNI_083980 [Gregarina niphandrodes]EZG65159.1 hypothetical protein GNI_083980 [Gregarina niphandrodes]|eukprot:XP_011134093.1 hypothetical protein GNI_083980 [Gregarina niphandrodes]
MQESIEGGSSSSSSAVMMPGGALRLLLWGDVEGSFNLFQESLNRAVVKFGSFDACICVGNFFGHVSSTKYAVEHISILERVRTLLPEQLAVSQVFIFDQPTTQDSLGGELQQKYPSDLTPLTDHFTLLPARGCSVILDNLRIATCAHPPHFAPDVNRLANQTNPPSDWTVVDLCLVSAWPENIQAGLTGEELLTLQSNCAL